MGQHSSPPHTPQSRVDEQSLALCNETRWPGNGVRLRVVFIDKPPPSPKLQQATVVLMNDWSFYSNVHFTLLDPSDDHIAAAEVRIRFAKDPGEASGVCWSKVGTKLLEVTDRHKPTMMLAGVASSQDYKVFHGAVRHEAGHILGFQHEHCRYGLRNRIDDKKAYTYYERNQKWDKSKVDTEILTCFRKGDPSYTFSDEEDESSVMCYKLCDYVLKAGQKDPPITGGHNLSEDDREWAGHEDFYPIPRYQAKVMVTGGAVVGITAFKKALYLLMRNGDIRACFELNGDLKKHVIGEKRDPKKTTLVASDEDKLYRIENNTTVSVWRGSFGKNRKEWRPIITDNIVQVDFRSDVTYYLNQKGTVMMHDGNKHRGIFYGFSIIWDGHQQG
ncbi:hypothetical protein AAF712_014498 [Marasmius tenuissimus]|uniref:Metalloendopeptidase n=1 Tax=Marasmius tenuissimus TaxID=585030 RepID=A0ABR2ZAV6_9AGAR